MRLRSPDESNRVYNFAALRSNRSFFNAVVGSAKIFLIFYLKNNHIYRDHISYMFKKCHHRHSSSKRAFMKRGIISKK